MLGRATARAPAFRRNTRKPAPRERNVGPRESLALAAFRDDGKNLEPGGDGQIDTNQPCPRSDIYFYR